MAFIYIEEAHAENEWPIATPAEFAVAEQHTTVEDRLLSASKLQATLPVLEGFPVYADSMEGRFQSTYGAWPTRMYYFDHGELVHKADAVDATFDLMAFWESVNNAVTQRQ